jgi:hypothetical protein
MPAVDTIWRITALTNRTADRLWQGLWDEHNLVAEISSTRQVWNFPRVLRGDPYIQVKVLPYFLIARAKLHALLSLRPG